MSIRVERIGPRGTRPARDIGPVPRATPVTRRDPREDERPGEGPPRRRPAPPEPEDDGRPHVDVSA